MTFLDSTFERLGDGIHFRRLDNVAILGDGTHHHEFTYGIEDLRILKCGQRYLLVGCGKPSLLSKEKMQTTSPFTLPRIF